MPIQCVIVSQDGPVFDDRVDMVVLPGAEGMMGILPNHSPLLTVLQYGIITVRKKGGEGRTEEQYFTVAGGIVEVQPDQVTVLADAAEDVMSIDLDRAESSRRRAEEALKSASANETDPDTYLSIQAALRRSDLQIQAVKRYRRGRGDYSGS